MAFILDSCWDFQTIPRIVIALTSVSAIIFALYYMNHHRFSWNNTRCRYVQRRNNAKKCTFNQFHSIFDCITNCAEARYFNWRWTSGKNDKNENDSSTWLDLMIGVSKRAMMIGNVLVMTKSILRSCQFIKLWFHGSWFLFIGRTFLYFSDYEKNLWKDYVCMRLENR